MRITGKSNIQAQVEIRYCEKFEQNINEVVAKSQNYTVTGNYQG